MDSEDWDIKAKEKSARDKEMKDGTEMAGETAKWWHR
jgi:hypothetical protein